MNIETNKTFRIYQVRNQVNGCLFIGMTTDTITAQFRTLMRLKGNYLLNQAITAIGVSEFSVTELCSTDNEVEAKKHEQYYIKLLKSFYQDFGYNIESKTEKNKMPMISGLIKNEPLARATRGVKQSSEWVANRIHHAGSEDAKKYISSTSIKQGDKLSGQSYWLGKERSDETKEKISQTKKSKITNK